LDSVSAAPSPWKSVLPQPGRQHGAARPPAVIASPDLLEAVTLRRQAFRPTGLESYLQCPFQFFGRDTLRLQAAPARPEQRLDFRTQGTIVHAVLAAIHGDPQALEETFDRIFRRICEEQCVPPGYRTEACRQRMLADVRALVEDPAWTQGYQIRTEQKFRYKLGADVEISGRIDRIDVAPNNGAYVIDYKYSGAQNTKSRGTDETLLQPQLYLLAIERSFELRPEGMTYWGLKGGVQRNGWSAPFPPGWLQQAVEATPRDTCVVAGPGSGKTTVLVAHFERLVESGVDPLRILAITFTDKAANNMRDKLARAFHDRAEIRGKLERAYVSTVHGFCARLLKENAVFAGLDPEFYVMDERESLREQRRAVDEILDGMFAEQPDRMRALMRGLAAIDAGAEVLDAYDAIRAAGVK